MSLLPCHSAGALWSGSTLPSHPLASLPSLPLTATATTTTATNHLPSEWTVAVAKELKVVGLINIQFAVQDDVPYIIEANPRASR